MKTIKNTEQIPDKHLELKDILAFVSATEENEETERNAVLVTTHIRSCRKCLNLVRRFQELYDELWEQDREDEFEERVFQILKIKDKERSEKYREDFFKHHE